MRDYIYCTYDIRGTRVSMQVHTISMALGEGGEIHDDATRQYTDLYSSDLYRREGVCLSTWPPGLLHSVREANIVLLLLKKINFFFNRHTHHDSSRTSEIIPS